MFRLVIISLTGFVIMMSSTLSNFIFHYTAKCLGILHRHDIYTFVTRLKIIFSLSLSLSSSFFLCPPSSLLYLPHHHFSIQYTFFFVHQVRIQTSDFHFSPEAADSGPGGDTKAPMCVILEPRSDLGSH